MSTFFLPKMPEWKLKHFKVQFYCGNIFAYFKSNLLFWAFKILTLNVNSLKKSPQPPSHSQFLLGTPQHPSFIRSLIPSFQKAGSPPPLKELDTPLPVFVIIVAIPFSEVNEDNHFSVLFISFINDSHVSLPSRGLREDFTQHTCVHAQGRE